MKEYIIYGAGLWGRKLYIAIESLGSKVAAYCDSNIGGQMINGCSIFSFEQFKNLLEQNKSLTVVIAIKDTNSRMSVANKIEREIGSWVKFEGADDIFNQYFETQLKKYHEQLTYKWNVHIDNYMDNWCDNLMNEVESWVLTAVNLNHPLHWKYDSYRRNNYLNIEEKKKLPIELHEESRVMDIGCGLFANMVLNYQVERE